MRIDGPPGRAQTAGHVFTGPGVSNMPSRLTGLVYAVKWSDFQGQVPAGATHTAHIDTRMNLQFGWRQRQGQVSLADNVVMTVLIRRQQSWAKTTGRTASLLAHEQRHYDITALMARDQAWLVCSCSRRSISGKARKAAISANGTGQLGHNKLISLVGG